MNTIEPEALQTGDVLVFRGLHPLSQMIQLVDDCEYDHVTVVVDDPSGSDRLTMAEVGFSGGDLTIVGDYPDHVEQILVRRHRDSIAADPVAAEAIRLAAVTKTYAFDRLLSLTLSSLARFSPRLAVLDPAFTARFIEGLHRCVAFAVGGVEPEGERRLCVEFVCDAHDQLVTVPDGGPDRYLGLVLPHRPLSPSLLSWATSNQRFADFVASCPLPRQPGPSMVDAAGALIGITGQFGGSVRLREEVSDDELRESTLATADLLVRWLTTSDRTVPLSDSGYTAAFLLEQLIARRVVMTQYDIVHTRSLFDVGLLDVDAIDWTFAPANPRPERWV